ncbi:PhnA-like protein [Mesorhizobium sp. BAC0120]|uniref:PhnA-like protein n=1 Tax=Mesorhizobium sp. BAC0120 TaxID=3090670 RepID=UPI00298D0195|nr:PhnA-like protein [Mesorhizobium sp. BAC0120]MDW6020202.1 PhnA-like protein [Mesorhizobium sp. BAC0120]
MADDHHPDTPRNRGDYDAPHTSPITPGEDARTVMINRVAWGAVFAGAVLALVIQIILNMIGIGVGAATLDAGSANNPAASTFSIGAGIWFAISGILAALAGGYAAGRLAGMPRESTAGWHGLTAWAVSTLVIVYLLTTTIGGILGGTLSSLGNIAGTVGQTAAQAARQPGGSDAFSAIQQALQASGADNAAIAAMRAAITGDPGQAQQAREQAAQALAHSRNIPIEEARNQVSQYQQQFQDTARNVAHTTATATSTGALLGAVGLILGAIAAWFGGRMGAVDPTMTAGLPLPTRPSRSSEPAGAVARRDGEAIRPEQRPH